MSMQKKRKIQTYCIILTSIILVFFFLFQTGFIYEITGDLVPSSISLSKDKMEDLYFLVHESDVYGAVWLSRYGDIENYWTFADIVSVYHVLTSYSKIDRTMIFLLSNSTIRQLAPGTYYPDIQLQLVNAPYIYLSQSVVTTGIVPWWIQQNIYFEINEIPLLNSSEGSLNRIYSNGFTEIYYRTAA